MKYDAGYMHKVFCLIEVLNNCAQVGMHPPQGEGWVDSVFDCIVHMPEDDALCVIELRRC